MTRWFLLAACLTVSTTAAIAQKKTFNDKPSADDLKFFEAKIRPVLIEQCYSCHSEKADKIKGGLLLDTRTGTRAGGDGGAIIAPGDPNASSLMKAIRYKDDGFQMPPKKKLPDAVIADFETWIRMGAPDPRDGGTAPLKGEIDIAKGKEFWSFQKPKAVAPPAVKNMSWPATDVDRFVLAEMEKAGLTPVADADPRSLVRRVYFDLVGLPPPPELVEQFAFKPTPEAYRKIVDDLLASPAFGERWGRHWLDVARYAETSGKTVNMNYPHAWRYRDYVIQSFNADKPYDRFVKEQLAGDLMTAKDDKHKAELLVATGFLAIGPKALNERNRLHFELDNADEQIDVTTQAFLGITAACARCHDHKFDPIPMADYYALAGIFRSTETCYGTVRFVQAQHPAPLLPLPKGSAPSAVTDNLTDKERKEIEANIERNQKAMADQKDPIRNIFNFAQIALERSKLDSYDSDGTPKLLAMGTREKRRPADSPIYTRGEPEQPGKTVPRGTLQVASDRPLSIPRNASGRKELADWIASPGNPLTARVMVNRIWLHLFGKGLVPTADNFGAAGLPPTHPELLDALAVQFVKDGWSIKTMIRQLVSSRTYRLSTAFHAGNYAIDPDNEKLWRATPRRLDAEAIRDAMLAVSGQLNDKAPVGSPVAKVGEGPSARPRLGSNLRSDPNDPHRTVYQAIVRDNLPDAMALFDAADPSLVVAERATTTVPAQSLYLMNNAFVQRAAEKTAETLLKKTPAESDRIREAYLLVFGRPPTNAELTTAEKFLRDYKAKASRDVTPARPGRPGFAPPPSRGSTEKATWSALVQAMLGSAEFLYRN
jgi:cytochrome c553